MKKRKRNRIKGYDYSKNNLYFVTCCVKNKEYCLSEIVREESMGEAVVRLNHYGQIVNNQLHWLTVQYPYVVLHHHVIMPNHVHAVIEIDATNWLGTGRDLSLQHVPKIKSLSQLMGAFKTTSSKYIHLAGHEWFAWQRSFHDSIIRDPKGYANIMHYISLNPERWYNDHLGTGRDLSLR